MAALWLLGVSVALLAVDVHCMPVQQVPVTTGWGENAAPGSNLNAYYTVYAPGAGGQGLGFASSSPPQGSPSFSVTSGAQSAPSTSSVSVLPGNVPAVAPPSTSTGEGTSFGPIMPGPYVPPQPDYQAGQLSHVERSHDFGDHQTETEESSQSFPPSPPVLPLAQESSPAMTSMLRPGGWGPYPYYDYMFLTGQYPPGTLTYSSNSFDHGKNYWHEYRYRYPYIYPQPVASPVTSQEPSLQQVKTW